MRNNEWRWVYVSLLLAVVFIIVAFVSGTTLDCFSGGCALMFVSGFLAIAMFDLVAVLLSCKGNGCNRLWKEPACPLGILG
jgi:archaellum biogenesis protein FlaJ (TadC family)